MDRRITGLIKIFVALFVILIINLTYLQIFASDSLNNSKYNTRSINEELSIKRGEIITSDGIVLAQSKKDGRIYKRVYPYGADFAHIVGYYDARLGRSGIEQSENNNLLGQGNLETLPDYIDKISGKNKPGNDVILTVNSRLQTAAAKALDGHKGSVVLLDARDNSVLAMASEPSYDPNKLLDNWSTLIKDKNSPLIARSTTGLYPPGSSFKVITASAAIDSGKATPAKIYPAPASLKIYGGHVTNYGNYSYGQVSLETAFAKSINTVFARVGLDVGQNGLVGYCNQFGFGQVPPIEIDAKASQIRDPKNMDDLELAWTSVGQAGLLVTPLQMALVSSAIANKGVIYQPHLVKKIRSYDGKPLAESKKTVWKVPIKSKSAIGVGQMMRMVVKSGTGTAASITGESVAGKTGTAEIKGKPSHAWFIGYMPAEKPRYIIAVLIENGGKGGVVAAPIAKQVLEATLSK